MKTVQNATCLFKQYMSCGKIFHTAFFNARQTQDGAIFSDSLGSQKLGPEKVLQYLLFLQSVALQIIMHLNKHLHLSQ